MSIAGCTVAIGTCTVDPFTAPGPGGSVVIVLRYNALSVTGGQPLTLTVAAGSLSAQATVTVVVTQPSYSISVTGNPSTSSTVQGSPGSASYTVVNTSTNTPGPLAISFSVSGCTAAIAPCTTPGSISLAQGASLPVQVGYVGASAPASATDTHGQRAARSAETGNGERHGDDAAAAGYTDAHDAGRPISRRRHYARRLPDHRGWGERCL